MTVLAGFQTWLYRYRGQADIVVGCPRRPDSPGPGRADRLLREHAGDVRGDLSGDPTFKELLGRVRKPCSALCSSGRSVRETSGSVWPPNGAAVMPRLFFQMALVLQNAPLSWPARQDAADGLRVSPWMVDNGTSKYDLTLFLWEEIPELVGSIEYNRDLYDASTIERMWGVFTTLLSDICRTRPAFVASAVIDDGPAQRIAGPVERDTARYPAEQCFHELFTAQGRHSQSIAAMCGGRGLTYRSWTFIEPAGSSLAFLGGGSRSVGGSLSGTFGRSAGVFIGRAQGGRAYVPLDPAYPRERLGFMLDAAQAAVLLTQRSLLGILPPNSARIVCVDERTWISQVTMACRRAAWRRPIWPM